MTSPTTPRDPQRWQRIEVAFYEALDKPHEEAYRWLAARDDLAEDLRAEVRALLEAHHEAGEVFEDVVSGAADEVFTQAQHHLGQTIGAYMLVRELGRGGMGSVYLAERSDAQFTHQVAIKLVQQQLPSPYLIERFKAERQILARLSHPNIARLLDGGATEQGYPYIVMEYVQGRPIDAYCDEHRLGLRERLALFRQVCHAVHYAHQRLVVHRDLKPANILITEGGEPKLLDFGIAKLLVQEEPTGSADFTRTGQALMTPAYASPEQVRGEPITLASDVYALGVLLYRLLSGQAPYSVEGSRPAEIEKLICLTQPVRPSQRVGETPSAAATLGLDGDRLQRTLRGELDNIVLTALRKEPDRRYGSVLALASDLDNYLQGRAVNAQPDTVTYRLRKFVARNRLAVGATGAIVTLSTGFAFNSAQQAERIAAERDAAQRARTDAVQEQQRAEVISTFLIDLLTNNDPQISQGREITVREILDRGAAQVQRDLSAQPVLTARLLDTMGYAYLKLGDYAQAHSLLEQAFALQDTPDTNPSEGRTATLLHLGELAHAQDRLAQAKDLLEEAIEQSVLVHGEESERTATALDELGNVYRTEGDFLAAEPLHRRSLAAREQARDASPASTAHPKHNLAALLNNLGRYQEAEALAREAIAELTQAFGPQDSRVLNTQMVLAIALEEQGDTQASLQIMRRVVQGQRAVYGEDHPRLHNTLNNLGAALFEANRYEEGEQVLREALAMGLTLHGDHNNRTDALILNNLAWGLEKADRVPEAEGIYRQSLAARIAVYGETSGRVASVYSNLAGNLNTQGRLEEAEAYAYKALDLMRHLYEDDNQRVSNVRLKIGDNQLRQGKPAEAAPMLRSALIFYERELPEDHPTLAVVRATLGRCLVQLGEYTEAEPLLLAAYEVYAALPTLPTQRATEATQALVSLYERLGQADNVARWQALVPRVAN